VIHHAKMLHVLRAYSHLLPLAAPRRLLRKLRLPCDVQYARIARGRTKGGTSALYSGDRKRSP